MSRTGKQYGDYVIQGKLGQGGMGEVYLATQVALDRRVAVKFITSERYADDINRRRFLREIRACSTLNHPNIVKIYDSGEQDGDIYLAMEYLDGKPLQNWIHDANERNVQLPVDFVLKIVEDVLESLGAMHPKGFIHRDIKPDNIMIGKFNRAVLMDFGLVKIAQDTRLTQTGRVLGTPRYLAPESLAGGPGDHRVDIYQVGLVMCEMLLGKIPFKQREMMEYAKGERSKRPTTPREARPDLPEEIQLLMQNALEVKPELRYQDSGEMLADLHRVREGKAIRPTRDVKQVGFPRVFPSMRLSQPFLDRYTFVEFVTRDPLVTIVLAHDKKRDRKVQLRFLSPDLTSSCPQPEALLASLQALAKLEHRNVFGPTAMGREEGVLYLAYASTTDPSFKETLETRDRFEPDVVSRLGQQLAAGLCALHAAGLVHGFLMPASILVVQATGTVQITDVELGVLARHTAFANTKESTTRLSYYSPPELLDEEPPTPASDLFSLAALLYRMLTGDYHQPTQSLEEDRKEPLRALLVGAMATDPAKRGGDLAWFGAELAKRAAPPPASKGDRRVPPPTPIPSGKPLGDALAPPPVRRPTNPDPRDLGMLDSSMPRRPPHPVFTRLLGMLAATALGIAVWLAYGGHVKVRDVLAMPEATRAVLSWTSSRPTESRLEVGTDLANVELVEDPTHERRTTHKLTTPPLKPGTSYVFRILLPRERKTDGYVFRTTEFETTPPLVLFQGMKALVSWQTNVRTTASVVWSGGGTSQTLTASAQPGQKHGVQLAGPLLLADSTVQVISKTETGDEHRSRAFPVAGPGARTASLKAIVEKLDLSTVLARLAAATTAPAELVRAKERLDGVRAMSPQFDELKLQVPAMLDERGVPADVKADLYRLAALFGHVEAAASAHGLVPPVEASSLTGALFALSATSRIDPAVEVVAEIPDPDRGFVPAGGGSRIAITSPARSQQTVKVRVPVETRPGIAEIELAWDALPPGRYLTVELPGRAELVFRAPPGSPAGPQTAYHGLDPALLGSRADVEITVKAAALPGYPPSAAKTVVTKIALRYRKP